MLRRCCLMIGQAEVHPTRHHHNPRGSCRPPPPPPRPPRTSLQRRRLQLHLLCNTNTRLICCLYEFVGSDRIDIGMRRHRDTEHGEKALGALPAAHDASSVIIARHGLATNNASNSS
jgi:hypothetical protein